MSDPNQPSVPPGWYPDGQGGQRWWDGNQWTEHQQPAPGAVPPPPAPPPAPGAPGQTYGAPPPPPPGFGAQAPYGSPQGYGYGAAGYGPAPSNYLVWSILATLLCCWPIGIVSIVKASQVNGLWNSGRYDEARKASDDAKRWAIISAILGLAVGVILVVAALGSNNR
jgi:hypothetical protein